MQLYIWHAFVTYAFPIEAWNIIYTVYTVYKIYINSSNSIWVSEKLKIKTGINKQKNE